MNIPFVDLKAQYLSIKKEIDSAVQNVISETAFIKSNYVTEFEQNYANKLGVKHCIGVGNGTDALFIILKMLGIGEGDEVITVANSWISSSEVITQTGAKVVFIDIEKDFFTIKPKAIEEKITAKTKAIIPVHLYGQMADMTEITKIADKYNLFVVEDCAQAHFAENEKQLAGTMGIASAFSFFPSKNLGAYGDAGAIITNDDELAEKMRMFANHGALSKPYHQFEGINSRLDGIQAAVLNVKLKYINQWTEQRIEKAKYYSEKLKNIKEIKNPSIKKGNKHVFHLYVIQAKQRDELAEYLKSKNIAVGIHYPILTPFLDAYEYLNHKKSNFPVAEKYNKTILSLPIYPELKNAQIDYIVENIKDFYSLKNEL